MAINKQPVVYLVDDDDLLLKTLTSVFRFAGFQVHGFSCPEEFLKTRLETEHACLIMDLRMPSMTGLELQDQLTARGVYLPIIVYSGNADVPMTVRVMREGAFTLVQKPVSNEVLVETTRKAMKTFSARQLETNRLLESKERFASLSEREQEVAMLVVAGMSSTGIADQLGIGRRTAEAHRSNILKKLDLPSTAALIKLVVLA
ncbi:response regulator transcription factor, partial [Marinobacter sediminum]|uniref:response regulator transcription factor n=1 Tax=Marinobacter sediminum TaxID=256323 RepID=UPI0035674703